MKRQKTSYIQLEKELEASCAEVAALRLELSSTKAAYEQLQQIERRNHVICEIANFGYMSSDKDGYLIEVNEITANLLGYRKEELVGKDSFTLFVDVDNDAIDMLRTINRKIPLFKYSELRKCSNLARDINWLPTLEITEISNGGLLIHNVIAMLRKKDGSSVTVMASSKLCYDEFGEFIRCDSIIEDLTELCTTKEALSRAEREKALILQTIPERIIYHDENRRIAWANNTAARDADMPLGQMIGKFCFVLFRNRSTPCKGCPVMAAFETCTSQRGEMLHDGKILDMTAHPAYDKHNRFVGVVQVAVDITERKQFERELLDLSSTERSRIGSDLHNGMGQHLTGILFLATALRKQLADLPGDGAETAARIVESADSALKQMRMALLGLCLIPDGDKGLISALAVLATNTSDVYRIECLFSHNEPLITPNSTVASHLFHIAQEAVNNAVKYSNCSRIIITLDQRRAMVTLVIQDNGNGLDLKLGGQSGMGLRNMRYRASLIGAGFEVSGITGKGTTISCRMPAALLRKKESYQWLHKTATRFASLMPMPLCGKNLQH